MTREGRSPPTAQYLSCINLSLFFIYLFFILFPSSLIFFSLCLISQLLFSCLLSRFPFISLHPKTSFSFYYFPPLFYLSTLFRTFCFPIDLLPFPEVRERLFGSLSISFFISYYFFPLSLSLLLLLLYRLSTHPTPPSSSYIFFNRATLVTHLGILFPF